MAVTSYGYAGTIMPGEPWAAIQRVLGRAYYVADSVSVLVTAYGAGLRQVQIAPGPFGGHGVYDENSDAALVQLPEVASGVEYFLIVVRRNWTTPETTFGYVSAGTDPSTLPARQTQPGILDEQPLALVSLAAGAATPVVVADLRVWGLDLLQAVDKRVLQYRNEPGTQIKIGTSVWTRTSTSGSDTWAEDPGPYGAISLPSLTGTSALVPASGWDINSPLTCELIPDGNQVDLHFEVRRTGSQVQSYSTGNFADTLVGTVPAPYRPSRPVVGVASYFGGPDSSGWVTYTALLALNPSGTLVLWHGSPGAHIWPMSASFNASYGLPVSVYGHLSFTRRS